MKGTCRPVCSANHHRRVDQQRMIQELKYQQDQQMIHHQLSNLEALKEEQVDDLIQHLQRKTTSL